MRPHHPAEPRQPNQADSDLPTPCGRISSDDGIRQLFTHQLTTGIRWPLRQDHRNTKAHIWVWLAPHEEMRLAGQGDDQLSVALGHWLVRSPPPTPSAAKPKPKATSKAAPSGQPAATTSQRAYSPRLCGSPSKADARDWLQSRKGAAVQGTALTGRCSVDVAALQDELEADERTAKGEATSTECSPQAAELAKT